MDSNQTQASAPFNERDMSMWIHLATYTDFLVPFSSILVKVLLWKLNTGKSDFFERQAKEAINFEITMWIVAAICIVLIFVLIGIPLFFISAIISLVLPIVAAIRSHDGVDYRYPISIRFIK